MSGLTRRDLLRVGAFLATSFGLDRSYHEILAAGLDGIASRQSRVLWLQGMSCTGCSISFLNADAPGILEILTDLISLVYHPNVSAAQGIDAMKVIDEVTASKDFYLVVEGSVPLGMPAACMLGGRPFNEVLAPALRNARMVFSAGSCSAFGGIPAAQGNVTGSTSVREFMKREKIPHAGRLINCPGCPVHPECLLGTIAYAIAKGYPAVAADRLTPDMFYKHSVHDDCPRFHYWEKQLFAEKFGDEGCLFKVGCLGPLSRTACSRRQWNSGVNWCIRAGAPCIGCTSEGFALDRDFPFYRKGEQHHRVTYQEADRKGS